MINTGVQREVKAAIQPVDERLELQEKVNQDLHEQLSSFVMEMALLKKKQQQTLPVVPAQQVEQRHQVQEGITDIGCSAGASVQGDQQHQ